jgi:hypothetical protein
MNINEKYAEALATIRGLNREVNERVPLRSILWLLSEQFTIGDIILEWPDKDEVREYLDGGM